MVKFFKIHLPILLGLIGLGIILGLWVGTSIASVLNEESISIFSKQNKQGLLIGIIIAVLFFSFYFWILIKLKLFGINKLVNREDKAKSSLHGAARFQTEQEMIVNFGDKINKKSEYFKFKSLDNSDFEGLIVKSVYDKKNKELNVLTVKEHHGVIVGGTGSGKSQTLASPSIQANANSKNKSSMLIYDLKGELYQSHSKLLHDKGYNVHIINLKEVSKSSKYNPLSLIWDLYYDLQIKEANGDIEKAIAIETQIAGYITEVATKLCPTKDTNNSTWDTGSQGIIKGIIWGMLEDSTNATLNMTKDKFTIAQIAGILNNPEQKKYFVSFLKNRSIDSKVYDKVGHILDNESPQTLSSYMSNTQSSLEKWTEKAIAHVTSSSDFLMSDFVDKPTAIFLVIDDTNSASDVLASFFTSQLRNYLVFYADLNGGSLDRTWYFMLDEFANIPKIESFPKWLSTDRSRKIFYFLFIQSLSQLKNVFNENESTEILNNCDLQILLSANEEGSLEYFQKLFGTQTLLSRSISFNTESLAHNTTSGTTSLTSRNLLNKDELKLSAQGECYFHYFGNHPCKSVLEPFYREELHKEKIFVKAEHIINKEFKQQDFHKTFFSLKKRFNFFEGEDDSPTGGVLINNNQNNNKVNTTEISTVSAAELDEILNSGNPTASKIELVEQKKIQESLSTSFLENLKKKGGR